MKRLLTLILIHSACVSFAQNKTIDSLQQALMDFDAKKLELHKNLLPDENDTTKLNILNALSRQYWQVSNYAAARTYADDALTIAQQIGYKKGIAQSYNNIGNVYVQQGNYPEALKNHITALKIREETGDKKGIAGSYNNIGLIYKEQRNYPEALKNFSASLKIFEETNDTFGLTFYYNNIGLLYSDQGNYPEAIRNYSVALKLCEKLRDKEGIGLAYINLGEIYSQQGNYPESLNNALASLKIFEEIGDKNLIAKSYTVIGNVKVKTKMAGEGKNWLVNGLMIAKEIGAIESMKGCYHGLAAADSALGNYKSAYENHKLFDLYRDSLNNEEATKKSLQTKMQYEFDKKEAADSIEFVQEKELAAVKLQKQKAITYGGFAGIAITSVLLFFVYRNYNKQRIANQKLKEAQEQLIKSEKMAAFGMMASRVSHEIQNPLNFVNNFSDLAEEMVNDIVRLNSEQERNETAKDLITNLQKIKHHGKRADAIVKQLQEHTYKGTAHEYFETKQQKYE